MSAGAEVRFPIAARDGKQRFFCSYKDWKRELRKPLKQKIDDTENIIAERLGEFGYSLYVAWSGGKDSTLVVHFARKYLPDVPVMFNNTGVEYPETVEYVRRLAQEWELNLIETKPLMPFWKVVERFGLPERRSKVGTPQCCRYLKEYPAMRVIKEKGFKAVMTGITGAENKQRELLILRKGFCYFAKEEGIQKIHPLYHWTPQDVLRFYKREGLPLNPIYAKVDRCGCMPCTGHIGWKSKMGRTNPKLLRHIMRMQGYSSLEDFPPPIEAEAPTSAEEKGKRRATLLDFLTAVME